MSDRVILFGDEYGLRLIMEALPLLSPLAIVYSERRPQASTEARKWGELCGCEVLAQPGNRTSIEYQRFVKILASMHPELGLCCSYDLIFDQDIMNLFSSGILNVHGALLPRYRGANVLNWVLINDETQTGVTLHRIVKEVDAGPIVNQLVIPIDNMDTAVTLRDKISAGTVELLRSSWHLLEMDPVPCKPQDESRASYYRRRKPEDGFFDWNWPAEDIYNLIRALVKPWPGAWYLEGNQKVVIDYFLSLEEVKRLQKEKTSGG